METLSEYLSKIRVRFKICCSRRASLLVPLALLLSLASIPQLSRAQGESEEQQNKKGYIEKERNKRRSCLRPHVRAQREGTRSIHHRLLHCEHEPSLFFHLLPHYDYNWRFVFLHRRRRVCRLGRGAFSTGRQQITTN